MRNRHLEPKTPQEIGSTKISTCIKARLGEGPLIYFTYTWTIPYTPSMETFWNNHWLKISLPLLETENKGGAAWVGGGEDRNPV